VPIYTKIPIVSKKEGLKRFWNSIAWLFIILQSLLLAGGTFNYVKDGQPILQIVGRGLLFPLLLVDVCLSGNFTALLQLSIEVTAFNLLAIGALLLGLVLWLHRRYGEAKKTVVAAIVVIILGTILYWGDKRFWPT